MNLYVLRAPESENHIFSVWPMCVRVPVCVSVCVISIAQNQITAESSNLVFYICIIYRYYLKLSKKIGQKLCLQGHTKEILIH